MPDSNARGITPEEKISGEEKIVAAPKIGERLPEKEAERKKDEPELRHPICEKGDCKEPPKPEPPESELRRPICLKGPCPCPPGQSEGKGGCVPPVVNQPPTPCPPGLVWSGGACLAPGECPAGQTWNGATCVVKAVTCPAGQVRIGTMCQADCSGTVARLAGVMERLRMARHERDDACRQNPSGTTCAQADSSYELVLNEYRSQMAGVPIECQGMVPDPSSII